MDSLWALRRRLFPQRSRSALPVKTLTGIWRQRPLLIKAPECIPVVDVGADKDRGLRNAQFRRGPTQAVRTVWAVRVVAGIHCRWITHSRSTPRRFQAADLYLEACLALLVGTGLANSSTGRGKSTVAIPGVIRGERLAGRAKR